MDKYALSQHSDTLALANHQSASLKNDIDFCRLVKFKYSPSSWGKIKAGTFDGNSQKAISAIQHALTVLDSTDNRDFTRWHDLVVLDHMAEALDCVELARSATDEHKLVIISGTAGTGKTKTAHYLAAHVPAVAINAKPSWEKSYPQTLREFASKLGVALQGKSSGYIESAILQHLDLAPCLLIIDEANHFSRSALNFIKTILNETKCAIVLLTLPHYLEKMRSDHLHELPQLIRRAVGVIRIPSVTGEEITAIKELLYPQININGITQALAGLANVAQGLDTVCRVLDNIRDGMSPQDALTEQKRKFNITR